MRRRVRRYATRKVPPFESERTLCDALRDACRAIGWTFYPECSGWDAVLVLPDETQVGVQAKLRASVDVLSQTIVPARRAGPDVHAVLVPEASRAFRMVADEMDVGVLIGDLVRSSSLRVDHLERFVRTAPRSTHLPGRCWLPPFVPDGPAGVPCPRKVSPWRVAAARLCAELRLGHETTNAEIRERGMAPESWTRMWLEAIPGTRPRRYRARPGVALPDVAFPDVAAGLGLPVPTRAA